MRATPGTIISTLRSEDTAHYRDIHLLKNISISTMKREDAYKYYTAYTYRPCMPVSLQAGIAQSTQRWATGLMVGVRFLTKANNSSLLHSVQIGSGPTPPPVQWAPGALSPGVRR
jgi:hypothetical protein